MGLQDHFLSEKSVRLHTRDRIDKKQGAALTITLTTQSHKVFEDGVWQFTQVTNK